MDSDMDCSRANLIAEQMRNILLAAGSREFSPEAETDRGAVMIDEVNMVVALQLGLGDVRAADRVVEDLGAESADVANIVAALEDKYGITIDESELQNVRTVSDLHDVVRRGLEGRAGK